MPKLNDTELELSSLYNLTTQNTTLIKQASSHRIKFAESKDRFTKIGFDLFRDAESEFIWKLEKDSETGEEYIVRTASKDSLFQTSQGWGTQVSRNKDSIVLVYKGHAIKNFKKADINFTDENIEDWRRFLVDKLATDPNFLKEVVASIDPDRHQFLLKKFPELK